MSKDWQEDSSRIYRQLAQIAVPARARQLAALLCLIPFSPDESFRVVELASGEGYLSQAILQAFSQSRVLALDYEASMRAATRSRLNDRGEVAAFDIRQTDWFESMQGADVVISSLCIHHLDDAGKQRLFNAVQAALSERGALLIADLVQPVIPQANRLFAATWDHQAETAALEQIQSRELFEIFQREQWNLYHHPDPDFDKPSPLFEQLRWLQDAGFNVVDCFWTLAGHAIYGGYKQIRTAGLTYDASLTIASGMLRD